MKGSQNTMTNYIQLRIDQALEKLEFPHSVSRASLMEAVLIIAQDLGYEDALEAVEQAHLSLVQESKSTDIIERRNSS